MNELRVYDAAEDEPGLPHRPGHRADPPLRRRLVAARAHPRLRARLHPPGRDFVEAIADGEAAHPSFADALGVQRVLAAVGAERRAGTPSWVDVATADQRQTKQEARAHEPSADHPVHRPVGRPAVRGGVPARLASGATTAWRSPAGATISTWPAARPTTPTSPSASRSWPTHGLEVYAISNHLNGQAVCDHPIDERHQGILSARVWGDGDPEGVRQRAAEEMKDTARTARPARASTPWSASPARRSGTRSRCSRRSRRP